MSHGCSSLAKNLTSASGYFIDVNETFYHENMTRAEQEESHKNLMSYNDTYNLNIPPELTRCFISSLLL